MSPLVVKGLREILFFKGTEEYKVPKCKYWGRKDKP